MNIQQPHTQKYLKLILALFTAASLLLPAATVHAQFEDTDGCRPKRTCELRD